MSYAQRVELIQTCHHCVHIDLQSTIVVAVNLLLLFTLSMESRFLFILLISVCVVSRCGFFFCITDRYRSLLFDRIPKCLLEREDKFQRKKITSKRSLVWLLH